jgi:hypothetical protein
MQTQTIDIHRSATVRRNSTIGRRYVEGAKKEKIFFMLKKGAKSIFESIWKENLHKKTEKPREKGILELKRRCF